MWAMRLYNGAEALGYYVADDEDVTNESAKACTWVDFSQAEAEAELVNSQWGLPPGFCFKPVTI